MIRPALHTFSTLVAAAWLAPAHALESPWSVADRAEVRLIGDHGVNASIRAGVEVRLQKGWKTYWRYPGDAGVPPRFDWSGSDNLAGTVVQWPAPERLIDASGMQSIGYHDHVLFPVIVRASDPARPVKLRLKFDFAVCEQTCVPADATLALDIPPGESTAVPPLDQAVRRVPQRASLGKNAAGLAIQSARLERGAKPHLVIEATAGSDLFAEGPDDRWALPLPEKIESKPGKDRFRLPLEGAPNGAPPIPPRVVLTLVGAAAAIEVEVPLD